MQMIMLILIVNFTYSVIGMHLFEVGSFAVMTRKTSCVSLWHTHAPTDRSFIVASSLNHSERNDGRHDGVTAPPPRRRPLGGHARDDWDGTLRMTPHDAR